MRTDIVQHKPTQTVSIFEQAAGRPITSAIAMGKQLKYFHRILFQHKASSLGFAMEKWTEYLPKFEQAEAACGVLFWARRQDLTRGLAAKMIGALLGAFGAKADPAVLAGMFEVLKNEELGRASEMWDPVDVDPTVLALACRKLITTATFTPKPAELHAACKEACYKLRSTERTVEEFKEFMREVDAVIFEFAHDEWQRQHSVPLFRPALTRMLELHAIWGNGIDNVDRDLEEGEPRSAFELLVESEQAKLAITETPKLVRAAHKRRSDVKHSARPVRP